MNILITGAGGFVGQLLAEHLLNDGHNVILTDIFEPPVPAAAQNKENATCIKCDIYEQPGSILSKDLDAIYERIEPFQPDFVKIVPTAKHLTDNVTLMRFIERMNENANIIGICMGDAGIISRVLGLRAGSTFTFAAATHGEHEKGRGLGHRAILRRSRAREHEPRAQQHQDAPEEVVERAL